MTTYYVGPGGNDGNDGLTWANRFLTLNGAEDEPVAAGDTVYVGPGIYREKLIVDVSGTSGNPITYIGDITGEHTDGIGGLVRITGSDNDSNYPNIRAALITIDGKIYRTFRGFYLGQSTGDTDPALIIVEDVSAAYSNIIIEFCIFDQDAASVSDKGGIDFDGQNNGEDSSGNVIRNCLFMPGLDTFRIEGELDSLTGLTVENCMIYNPSFAGMYVVDGYNTTFRCCTFCRGYVALNTDFIDSGHKQYSYDNHFKHYYNAMESSILYWEEDYNFFDGATSDVSGGANNVISYLPESAPLMVSGYRMPWDQDPLVGYNDNVYANSYSDLTKDLHGIVRTTEPKNTPGALQFMGIERDDAEFRGGLSSLRMNDASVHLMSIPINGGKKITVTVYVKRETDYAGTNPQLAISLPTQGRVTVTDAGSTGSYNKLSLSVATTSADRWMQIELRSNNTATSGDYQVWFDSFKVKASAGSIPSMKWITNEIVMFNFALDEIVDPWITPTIPVPDVTLGPVSEVDDSPLPAFHRA